MNALSSFTRNLPPVIKDSATSLLGISNRTIVLIKGNHCYVVLVENLDVFHPQCLKLGVSKAVGLGIVLVGSIVKLPQLFKLINAKSGAGLSLTSYILEAIGYIITLAYNVRGGFPFSTYGETAFISVQDILILLLCLHYARKDVYAVGALGAIVALAYSLFDPNLVSDKQLQILQGLSIPLSLASKVPQIVTTYQNGSTGQLSAFTVFNYLAGSLARVFTTIAEVNDLMIFWGFVAAAGLNAVLAVQMVFYWKSSPKTAVGRQSIKTSTLRKRSTTPRPRTPKTPTTPETPKTTENPKSPKSSRKGKGKRKN